MKKNVLMSLIVFAGFVSMSFVMNETIGKHLNLKPKTYPTILEGRVIGIVIYLNKVDEQVTSSVIIRDSFGKTTEGYIPYSMAENFLNKTNSKDGVFMSEEYVRLKRENNPNYSHAFYERAQQTKNGFYFKSDNKLITYN